MSRTRSVMVIALCLGLAAAGCSKRRTTVYPMLWSEHSRPEHIVLTFAEHPNHYLDVTSAELRAYLDGHGDERVDVELQLTTRLGCLERIGLVSVGEWTDGEKEWAGSGWVDQEEPSPWDELRCWIPWR